MTFNPNSRLDPSQVEDARGGGRMGRVGGRGLAIGGGGIGTIALFIIITLLGGGDALDGLGGISAGGERGPTGSGAAASCQTGADANAREDCRIVGYVNSIQQYWQGAFGGSGTQYQRAVTTFFTGQVDTACGVGDAASGPFYCPNDQHIYIDLDFFKELRAKFGANGGPLAQAYVIAHEYGHHVQNLSGSLTGSRGTGANSDSVKTELQADCYAGVWAGNAAKGGFIQPINDQQINDALSAAAAVGDDRIQRATQGRVDPERWTHGSSQQRQDAFIRGYRSAEPSACDNP
ncbi:MAG: neutral zinc metallopeptidase [Chloroflexi bacterium]|nr:neutral zinc metallopeptidase [Chloroflexota bacterium]